MSEPTTTGIAKRIETVKVWLDAQQVEVQRVLPEGMDASRFCRIALTQVLRNPKLAECDKASFVLAIMESAALGLEPDSVSGLSYLVPFKGKVQLIVGYRGLIQLAYRHPKVAALNAQAVFEGDGYQYEEGLRPVLSHRPIARTVRKPEEIVACYAIASIRGGGKPFVWLWREQIETEHRDLSPAYRNGYGPWLENPIPMYVKSAVRVLAKFIPQHPHLMQALARDADPELEPAPGSPALPPGTTVEAILDGIGGAVDETPSA